MAAIGSPTGPLVSTRIRSQIDELPRHNIHYVDIKIAVGQSPAKRKKLSIVRPCWIGNIIHAGQRQFPRVFAVAAGTHYVQLREAVAIADERDTPAGARVKSSRSAGAGRVSDLPRLMAGGVGHEQFRIAGTAGCKDDPAAIWSPGRRRIRTNERRPRSHAGTSVSNPVSSRR